MLRLLSRSLFSSIRQPKGPRKTRLEVRQLEERSVPALLYWVGEGADTNWSTLQNWRVGALNGEFTTAVPTSGDDLVFSSALPVPENPENPNNAPFMESSYNIASLTIESRPAQQYSLNLDGTLQITNSAQMDAGTLTGAGPMNLSPVESGSFVWNSGTIKTTVNVNAGTTFAMTGLLAVRTLNGKINVNAGNASWDGQGTFKIEKELGAQDAIFHIDSGATFTITRQIADAQIDMNANAYFDNYGTLNSIMGTTQIPKKLWFPGQGVVRNFGTFNVQLGYVGTRYLQTAGTISILPNTVFGMGVGNVAGTNGWTKLDGGSITGGAGRIDFLGDSTVEVTSGTATVGWVIDQCAEVKGSGNLLVTRAYFWDWNVAASRTSHWTGSGKVQIGTAQNPFALLKLEGEVSFKSARPIINYGVFEWVSNDPGAIAPFTLEMEGTADIQNKASGTMFINAKGTAIQKITGPANSGKLINFGLLELDAEKSIEIDLPVEEFGGDTNLKGTGAPNIKFLRGTKMSGGNLNIEKPVLATFVGGVEHTGGDILNASEMIVQNGYTLSGGTLDSTPAFFGSTTFTADTLTQSGGSITNGGDFEVTGLYTLSGGTYTSQGYTTEPVTFIADAVTQTGGIFTFDVNAGMFEVSDTYTFNGGEATVRSSPYETPNTLSFGELVVAAPNFILAGPTSASAGIHVASGGELQLSGYDTLSLFINANVTVAGLLDITHGTRVVGNLTNTGIVHLGLHDVSEGYDSVTVEGNYTQTSTGTLRMDHATSGTADLLNITGVATLAGTLEYVAPFMSPYSSYQLMSFGSLVGMFDTLIAPPGAPATIWSTAGSLGIQGNYY